ncbi:hypothetical protein [Streptomyces sp. NPDC049881]|uniref:hypothetical protein n=1 Tax=Streptomyces sp. NPDC049881 TaxID=3155778 RepID=UPI003420D4E0
MSFDDEWRAIQAESARATRDLSVHQDDLGRVGSAAYELHGRLAADADHARAATAEAATGLTADGLVTGTALATLLETWASQTTTLLDACAHISNHLDHSAAAHQQDEADIAASLSITEIDRRLSGER